MKLAYLLMGLTLIFGLGWMGWSLLRYYLISDSNEDWENDPDASHLTPGKEDDHAEGN